MIFELLEICSLSELSSIYLWKVEINVSSYYLYEYEVDKTILHFYLQIFLASLLSGFGMYL